MLLDVPNCFGDSKLATVRSESIGKKQFLDTPTFCLLWQSVCQGVPSFQCMFPCVNASSNIFDRAGHYFVANFSKMSDEEAEALPASTSQGGATEPARTYIRSLRLSSEKLKQLPLKRGTNEARFSITTKFQVIISLFGFIIIIWHCKSAYLFYKFPLAHL